MTTDYDIRVGYVGALNLQGLDGLTLKGQKLAEQRQSYGSYYGIEWKGREVKYLGQNINAIDETVLGIIYKNIGATPLV